MVRRMRQVIVALVFSLAILAGCATGEEEGQEKRVRQVIQCGANERPICDATGSRLNTGTRNCVCSATDDMTSQF